MFDFNDQVVMITGAAGNLGRATTRAFQAAGASLVLVGHRMEDLETTFSDLAETENHLFVAVDLTDAGGVEGMAYEVVQQYGQIDVLVNIVGGFRKGSPVHEMSLKTWRFMMDLNATSIIHTARAIVPHMVQRESGKVISVAARAGLKGKAGMGAYTVSKSAVIRLTETMSAELKDRGINVNCILPSTIDTPQNREAMPKANHEKWVRPEAIADVILFLASDAARAIQGAAVPVYGRS